MKFAPNYFFSIQPYPGQLTKMLVEAKNCQLQIIGISGGLCSAKPEKHVDSFTFIADDDKKREYLFALRAYTGSQYTYLIKASFKEDGTLWFDLEKKWLPTDQSLMVQYYESDFTVTVIDSDKTYTSNKVYEGTFVDANKLLQFLLGEITEEEMFETTEEYSREKELKDKIQSLEETLKTAKKEFPYKDVFNKLVIALNTSWWVRLWNYHQRIRTVKREYSLTTKKLIRD